MQYIKTSNRLLGGQKITVTNPDNYANTKMAKQVYAGKNEPIKQTVITSSKNRMTEVPKGKTLPIGKVKVTEYGPANYYGKQTKNKI